MDEAAISSPTCEFAVGARVKVNGAAGPRLASKQGTVTGPSTYRDAVRLILDGYKTRITLNKKYLTIEAQRGLAELKTPNPGADVPLGVGVSSPKI